MYNFPYEMRKAYEASPLSFVYYQNVDGNAIPVLASGGFFKNVGMGAVDSEWVLEWLETGLFDRMHPDDTGLVSKVSDDFLKKEGPYDIVFRCLIGDSYQMIHGVGKWQTMPDGTELAVIVYVNITETRDIMNSVIEKYGLFQKDRFYSDSLTGLPNINYLHEFAEDRVNVIRSEGAEPVVVYCDIYSMQSYNNQYGFSEGDKLLRLVASELQAHFPDALLVRGADDQFIFITEDREDLTDRLGEATKLIRKKAYGNTSGIRSGICHLGDSISVSDGINHAKNALKRINNDMTREFAIFSQEADDKYWNDRYIIESFDKAIEEKRIRVYYQGIIRTETGKLSALEALARWVDPVRGVISPGDFIPVLQRYHQLYKLDLNIFEQVCSEVRERLDNGLDPVPVSVNFSGQDFDHVDVTECMDRIYDRYEMSEILEKKNFIVEITEQDVASGSAGFWEQLGKIREAGYSLWLDDFGSGYSALNVFSRFNFDLVKYDMELLHRLNENGGVNRVILRSLVETAKKLGAHTLIEGLESEEQLEFVRDIGCELIQGFYYSRPEPLEAILKRLSEGDRMKVSETAEERLFYERKWLE